MRLPFAAVFSLAVFSASAGIGRMESKPLWDLADHGGATEIGSDKTVEIPNSCIPDTQQFTIEAKYRFDDMSNNAVVTLLDSTAGNTGFGAFCDTIPGSGKTMKLMVNGENYRGSGMWFLGGHKNGRAWWKPNGTELKLTISARKGWLCVYQDDRLANAYKMQVTPNLSPVRAGGKSYGRDKSKYPDMKGVTLLSLKIWDGAEPYRGIGEPEKRTAGFAAGKGWQVRVPCEPLAGRPNIFYYGDSISVGYTPSLAALVKGRANLYHWMSFLHDPGEKGVDQNKFIEIGRLADYDYVVFNNGAHSTAWTDDKVSDSQIRDSYQALVKAFRNMAPNAKKLVYIMTTPRTRINDKDEKTASKVLAENKTIKRLNRIAKEVMDAERVPVLDFYDTFSERTDYWRGDGYHFKDAAYECMSKAIVKELGLEVATTATPTPSAYDKFLWIELIGFDNTKPDYGVAELLSRMDRKPQAVSLLLTEHSFFHEHCGLGKDFTLPEGVTSYDSREKNEERNRQDWTAWQLRGLVKELRSRGIDVFPSFFEWGIFDICAKTKGGEPYVDFFIRQTLAFLKDYGFSGLHASDGFGHPRLGLGQRSPKVTDWRKAADDWTAFWRKASSALKREGYKTYLNTVWTRDPYEALVRYGMDYDALCDTDIDGFVCESSASVLELEGWNKTEEKTLDKTVAMLTRMGTCIRGRKRLLLLHCIKDGNEQYNALRHSPTRMAAEAMAAATVTWNGKRVLEGEMACLADGIGKEEWRQIDTLWDAAFVSSPVACAGCRVVWSDKAFRRECETLPGKELASTCTLLAKLVRKGAVAGGGITLENALADKTIPLLIVNPGCFPPEELSALANRCAPVVMFGYGHDAFDVAPTFPRDRYWPWPMYESVPDEAAFAKAVKAVNAASGVRPAKNAPDGLALTSFTGADGNIYIMARNDSDIYLNGAIKVEKGLVRADPLALDASAPVSLVPDEVGATIQVKLPPSGAIILKCRPSGGISSLPTRDTVRKWFAYFRVNEVERNPKTIWNYRAYQRFKDEIPLFDCPDREIVRTYYYRWWTFRKHLRRTDAGWVVEASMPKVGWTGADGLHSALMPVHLREGRWLKSSVFMDDYIRVMRNRKIADVPLPFRPCLESASLTDVYESLRDASPSAREAAAADFARRLHGYAASHARIRAKDGETVPWTDDKLDSTFCDLVIAGLCGITCRNGGGVDVCPLAPKAWEWWCLDNLNVGGRRYLVLYDRDGTHFNRGKGLSVVGPDGMSRP